MARAGLAPVGRLAAVAEQVTATGDPGRRVEVGRADELGRLATSFNTMLAALQRSLAAQRQLVSDASHELRTPLTSLSINAELLAAEPGLPEDERQEVLDRVVAQVAELGQLVAGVTELARGDGPAGAGRAVTAAGDEDFAPVDLAAVVSAALDGRPAGLAADRLPGRAAAMHRPGESRTAEDRRPQPAGQRGQVQPAGQRGRGPAARPASSPCATTGRGSTPTTCRTSSTVSTGRRRPGECPARASGWLSCGR